MEIKEKAINRQPNELVMKPGDEVPCKVVRSWDVGKVDATVAG